MLEANERLPESLENPAVFDLVPVEMFLPELDRPLWRGVRGGRNLTRTWPAWDPLVGKGGQDRSHLGVGIRVVEMVVSVATVKQHRLLDQPLTENLRAEVDVFLGAARTQGDVMNALD